MQKGPFWTKEDEFLGDEEDPDPAEEYLEALAMLEQLGLQEASIGEISKKVKVKPPSAVQMLRRLDRRGLVVYRKGSRVHLTSRGREIGLRMIRNGRLMEVFISKELRLPQDLHVAHALEHAVSKRFATALCTRLKHPRECPHGYEIPPGPCCPSNRRARLPKAAK